jgi:hypothetical protein
VTKPISDNGLAASTWTEGQLRRMDARFVRAVRKAIAAGLESVTSVATASVEEGGPGTARTMHRSEQHAGIEQHAEHTNTSPKSQDRI